MAADSVVELEFLDFLKLKIEHQLFDACDQNYVFARKHKFRRLSLNLVTSPLEFLETILVAAKFVCLHPQMVINDIDKHESLAGLLSLKVETFHEQLFPRRRNIEHGFSVGIVQHL